MVTRDIPWPDGTPCWVDLGAPDIDKAISFYTAEFGWEVTRGGQEVGGYSMAKLNGRNVAGIGPIMGPPGTPTAWATYFASADVDATAAKITGAGGSVVMEPTDVMDAGRMLFAVDTVGAPFGIWQAGLHTGAQVANVPGALTWTEHMSFDFAASKDFYAKVFGYEYGDMSSDDFSYATLLINGSQVVGGIGAYPGGTDAAHQAFWGVYFGTADTDKAIDQLTARDGKVLRAASDSPYGRMAVVADDQGAVFSLISTPQDDAEG